MALDRQDIQKTDFPRARRGYDPDAVDAHLRSVADEVDEAQRQPQASSAWLAGAASEQVRTIVEAAETTAADIRTAAEDEGRETRDRARAEAQSHVTRVEEAAAVMLQRIDAMQSELGPLMESLRTGATRLTADLTLLRDSLGELGGAATPTEPQAVAEEPEAGKAPTVEAPAAAEPAAAEAATGADDSEGARLIALNMALNGTPREETDRYLAENFELEDRAALLDDVYARVG